MNSTRTHRLRVEGLNDDRSPFNIHIAPAQLEDFALPHSSVERANDDGLEMSARPDASSEEKLLFLAAQDPLALVLVGDIDEWFARAEWIARNPTFALRDIQHPA